MIIALVQIIHLLWLSVLEFFPSTEFFIYPYLKALNWLPYSQIVDHHFPGLMLGPITFLSLGFSSVESFKTILLLVVLMQSFLIYKISKSKVAVVLYAIWQPFFLGNVLWYDLFLPLFTLPAYYFFTKRKCLWTGVFLGLGLIWKQSLLPLILFMGFYLLFKKRIKDFGMLALGGMIPMVLMIIYLMKLKVFGDFWYWNIVFNLTTYKDMASTLISKGEFMKLLIPVITMLLFGKWQVLLWGLLSIIGGLSRFGLEHLQPFVPFAAIAVAGKLKTKNLKLITLVIFINLIWVVSWEIRAGNFGNTRYFDQNTLNLVEVLKNKTQPGEEIFLMGVQPIVYPLSNTIPPSHYFSYQLPWIMKINEDKLLESWRQGKVRIAVRNMADTKNVSPKLVQYLNSNYQLINKVGNYEIYESRN